MPNPRQRSFPSFPLTPLLRATALALLCTLSAGVATPAAANTVSTQAEAERDPPGRVGRLADLQGQVWLYHAGDDEWIDAERNRPLTSGDRLATDGGARAEVRIGSTTLRLDGGTELEVLRLDDDRIELQLHAGSLAARLRSRETVPEFELRTGEGRFTVQRTGRYRFDRADETSHVTVHAGQALYQGPGSALTVNAGQRAEFWIDSANVAQYSIVEPARDAFAGWNAERDRAEDRSATSRYVSPEMTGVEDLDRYGSWEPSDEYGTLWVPRAVAPGWAPYSTGRWAWVAPWGWTWVDDAPWGFAPFHYGRWVYVSSRWCWSPGTYVRRPVYAPALVAWIGGPRLSVAVRIGAAPAPGIGWVPLAPREVYVPGYRVSPRYVRNVNVTHVTNITNITTIVNNPQQAVAERDYRNRKYPHAVTVMPAAALVERKPVAPQARPWRDAPAVRELADRPLQSTALVAPPAVVAPPARSPGTLPPRPWQVRRETTPPGSPAWPQREGPSPRRGDAPVMTAPRVAPAPMTPPAPARAPTIVPAPAPAAAVVPAPAAVPPPAPRPVAAPRDRGDPGDRGERSGRVEGSERGGRGDVGLPPGFRRPVPAAPPAPAAAPAPAPAPFVAPRAQMPAAPARVAPPPPPPPAPPAAPPAAAPVRVAPPKQAPEQGARGERPERGERGERPGAGRIRDN